MNCKCCGINPVFADPDNILCNSCLDDFASGMSAIDQDESILDRLIREQKARAKMPRFGLKPRIEARPQVPSLYTQRCERAERGLLRRHQEGK